MRPRLALAAVLALVASATGQEDHTIVFPLKFEELEGDSHDALLLNQQYIRWMQVDGDSRTNRHLVKFVRLRRDAFITSPNARNRAVDIEMRMGDAFVGQFGATFANNWLSLPTTVMSRKRIVLPDYTQLSPTHPNPFDLALPADQVYLHSGSFHLAFDLEVWDVGSGGGGYHVDATDATGNDSATSTAIGIGCITSTSGSRGFRSDFDLDVTQFGAAYTLRFAASGAPVPSLATFWLAVSGMPVLLPGLCQPIQVLPPLVEVGPFVPDGLGNVLATFPLSRYPPSWFGVRLFVQALAPDPTQASAFKVALSSGQVVVLPKTPHDMWHTYSLTPGSATGLGPFRRGLIIQISDTN